MSFFGVTEENLRELISTALSKGGEYADLFFEHSVINEVTLRDGEVNAAGTHIDYGVGIRVVKGEKTGYAYSEITTMPLMRKAALTAAQIADEDTATVNVTPQTKILGGDNLYPIGKNWEETNIDYKIPYLQMLNEKIFSKDNKTVKVRHSITLGAQIPSRCIGSRLRAIRWLSSTPIRQRYWVINFSTTSRLFSPRSTSVSVTVR